MGLHTEQSYWWRSKFLSECAWIVTCIHARRYASMLGDIIHACMAHKILVQLSTDTHEFEKYSRGATKYTRVTCTRASSLNRAVPYSSTKHHEAPHITGQKGELERIISLYSRAHHSIAAKYIMKPAPHVRAKHMHRKKATGSA